MLFQPVSDIVLLEDSICPREDSQHVSPFLPMTAMRDMCADSLAHTLDTHQATSQHVISFMSFTLPPLKEGRGHNNLIQMCEIIT